MRKLSFAVLLLGLMLLGLTTSGSPIRKLRPESDIEGFMRAGFGGYPPFLERPIKRAVEGKATKDDLELLLKLSTDLNKATPPKGDLEEWKKRTEELTKSVKAVRDNSNADTLAQLKKASDCKSCHDKFKPTPEEEAKRVQEYIKSKEKP